MPDTPTAIAAVDLGSNSFHMIVARTREGQLHVLDRLREPVRLAAGLTPDGRLEPVARARALDCLARFGERVRDLPQGAVRAVGTNTLRLAGRDAGFLDEARKALGHPIEVISGYEEARLIYQGVARSLAAGADGARRLVLDIGGGSTELILGEGDHPRLLESLYMGCVSMSERFFPDGRIDKAAMQAAMLDAARALEEVEWRYRRLGWDEAIGASGTVKAARAIIEAEGWDEGLTAKGLKKLRKALISAGRVDRLRLAGLSEDRRPVIAGGVAILSAVFKGLGLERMRVSSGALREGLLYDLLGRIRHQDAREASVRAMAERYGVDLAHAGRVETVAQVLFDQVREDWALPAARWWPWLHRAALLHEVGLVVAHSQYHKHGAYLIQHSDLAGFSITDQLLLATLVRGHRKRFKPAVFEPLPAELRLPARRLCILLRLAVLLQRGRAEEEPPLIHAAAGEERLRLSFAAGYLDDRPLTRADLAAERALLAETGFILDFE